MSGQDADVAALVNRLNGFCREHAWPLRMPEGVRLECHMSVLAALHSLPPDPDEFTSSVASSGDMLKPQIPVMVTAGMEHGAWRIAADDGTIDQGTIREAGPASFACPCCGAVMRHPDDIANRYCGRCHWYTGDPELGPPHLASGCEARPATPEGEAGP